MMRRGIVDDHEDDDNCEDARGGCLWIMIRWTLNALPANVKQLQNQHKHRLQLIHSHVIAILTITIFIVIPSSSNPAKVAGCINLSNLFHVFVKIVQWNCQSCKMYISPTTKPNQADIWLRFRCLSKLLLLLLNLNNFVWCKYLLWKAGVWVGHVFHVRQTRTGLKSRLFYKYWRDWVTMKLKTERSLNTWLS